MTWKQALTRAIKDEMAAEKSAAQADGERRRTWWETTMVLASVPATPRSEVSEAIKLYVSKTGHTAKHGSNRRITGQVFKDREVLEFDGRFALAAAQATRRQEKPLTEDEAYNALAQAKKDEQSLREFNLALTGKSWTLSPENLTEDEEDEIVEKVAQRRPHVVARQTEKPKVAKAVARNPRTRHVVRDASKDAEADEQDEQLEKLGISRQQRADRKAMIEAQLAAGAAAATTEWENTPPNLRGEMVLSAYAIEVFGRAEILEQFVNEVDNTDATWGDPDHVGDTIDIIDATIVKLENVKTQMKARIQVQGDFSVADIVGDMA